MVVEFTLIHKSEPITYKSLASGDV
jgi:hypothetical protein